MNKIRIISLGISILIHTSLIGMTGGSGWLGRLLPPIHIKEKDSLALEFVEIPETVPKSKAKKETKVISDKTVEAKDRTEAKVKEGKARTKEVSKGKQIAKISPPETASSYGAGQSIVHSPQPVVPEKQIQSELIGIQDKQLSTQQIPLTSTIEPQKVEYDIINIPEVSESIFSTPEEGPLTFETQAHKIGPYFKQIKRTIENYWLRYLVFKYQNTAPQESEAVVSFKILPSGEVTAVSILEYSGDILFRDFCVASITNTAPYPSLPENLKDEYKKEGGLNIVFTFRYR